jgi:hypothetical protein
MTIVIGYHGEVPAYAIQYRYLATRERDWHFGTPFAPDARETGSLETVREHMERVKRRTYSRGRVQYRVVSIRVEPVF